MVAVMPQSTRALGWLGGAPVWGELSDEASLGHPRGALRHTAWHWTLDTQGRGGLPHWASLSHRGWEEVTVHLGLHGEGVTRTCVQMPPRLP